jgi:hypothetical protein
MLRRSQVVYTGNIFIILSALILIYVSSGCESRQKAKEELPEYITNIEIEVELVNREDLTNMDRDDIIFTVINKGDKTIKELSGEVAFYDSTGKEMGHTKSILISVNPEMESIAVGEKKARWRSLPPGEIINTGYDFVYFFVGQSDLREELKAQWDDLTARVIIKKLVAE